MQERHNNSECMKRSITGGSAFSVGRALYKCKIYDKNRTKQDRDTMDHFIMEQIGNHALPTNAMPTNDPLFHYHAKHSSSTHRRVKEFGYSCRIPLVKPLLNHRQRQRRLTWAKEKKNWTVAQWSKVLLFR